MPDFVVIRGPANVVGGAVDGIILLAADLVPCNSAPHGRDEDFGGFDLIREGESDRIFCKHGGLFGDVSDQSTGVEVVFAADGWVSKGDYWEWDILVDVVDKWEVLVTGLNKRCAR